MPQDAAERIANLSGCMEMMDKVGLPMGDLYLDPLVFPIGAGPDFGNHYLDAVRGLREKYPEDISSAGFPTCPSGCRGASS